MNSFYHFIVILTFCMFSFHTKGQSSAGVKADVNLSNFWITQSTHVKSSMKAGGSAGFFYKYKWRENKAVQTDMMFRFRRSEFYNQNTGEMADYRYFGIEIPVYSMLQAEIDNQILYLGIGPFASFGLFSRYESAQRCIDLYQKDPISDKELMYRWDCGVGLFIGYELRCRLQFNFNYHLGVRNVFSNGFENVTMISQLNCLGVGYRF